MEEILLIDKPVGISSFDVIRRLRKEYKEKGLPVPKLGHAGTLDPLASGLMIIGVDAGTKKLHDYLKLPKEYVAEILVGESRTTGDMEGEIVEEKPIEEIFSAEKISSILERMIGVLALPVSAYSAIKKDGVPLYKRVRAGKSIGELPIRNMQVMEAELIEVNTLSVNRKNRAVVKVRFYVGSGTYIRSLAEDFGKRLGYPATLKSLRRTKIGEFKIEDARSI
jgi:tRNA pseudouridine55 synthase